MIENIEFIEISLVRKTLLGVSKPSFCFELFDYRWLTRGFCADYAFEIPSFSLFFREEKNGLLKEAKRYMGAIPSWVAEKIMLQKISELDETIAGILKNKMDDLISFSFLDKKTKILISFGEFHRFQHIIYEVGF